MKKGRAKTAKKKHNIIQNECMCNSS